MTIKKHLISTCLTLLTIVAPTAFGWTLHFTFNKGTAGENADKPGFDAFTGTKYTTEQSYEGGKGIILHVQEGIPGFGYWGGQVDFPADRRKGDPVWWRVRTYWPTGQSYEAFPPLKFMRLHTRSATEADATLHRAGPV